MHMKNPWIELVKNTNKGDNFTVKHKRLCYGIQEQNQIFGTQNFVFLKKDREPV